MFDKENIVNRSNCHVLRLISVELEFSSNIHPHVLSLGEFNVDVIQRIKQEEGKTITLDPWKACI